MCWISSSVSWNSETLLALPLANIPQGPTWNAGAHFCFPSLEHVRLPQKKKPMIWFLRMNRSRMLFLPDGHLCAWTFHVGVGGKRKPHRRLGCHVMSAIPQYASACRPRNQTSSAFQHLALLTGRWQVAELLYVSGFSSAKQDDDRSISLLQLLF